MLAPTLCRQSLHAITRYSLTGMWHSFCQPTSPLTFRVLMPKRDCWPEIIRVNDIAGEQLVCFTNLTGGIEIDTEQG